MTILGIGLDVVELDRIARIHSRFGNTFARRILTAKEFALLPTRPTAYLASRFAAKEAAVKALGTGFADGITLQQVEIALGSSGQPTLVLLGRALERAKKMGLRTAHVSLSHSRNTAAAMVVLEK
jgi:holo-[acyl-carrier protein] synthase